MTRPHGIPTVVSLNSIMVDGTGMCGGCRVHRSDGKSQFACVDGPEFDAHEVDFDLAHPAQPHVPRGGEASRSSEFREHPEQRSRAAASRAGWSRSIPKVRLRGPVPDERQSARPPLRQGTDQDPPQHMPSRTPAVRRHELQRGRTQGSTSCGPTTEALRCLACAEPKCMAGCPVGRRRSSDRRPDLSRGTWRRPPRPAKTTSCRRSPDASARRRTSARAAASWATSSSRWGSATSSGSWPTTSASSGRSACPRSRRRPARRSRSSAAVRPA